MEYINLFRTLSQNKIKYLICGGLAVNIYGIPRMTADIDILLEFEETNLIKFENSLKLLLYQASLPISIINLIKIEDRQKAIMEKNLIAFSYFNHQANYMRIDALIDVPIPFEDCWNRKETRIINNTEIYIVGIEDLITLKKYANRKQDQDDVLLLSKLLRK